ncbi:probable E3 ubiquitin-protein ligase DTX3 [Amphiura filiformis]|uniref:probable E3 ubiquitin-protein ligase DTX3 n=1 Tax=Amphiura filiformis TaxID=82378 RepID=UPI003B20E989
MFPPDVRSKELCSEAFTKAIRQFDDYAPKYIREVHVVNHDFESTLALQSSFGEEFKNSARRGEIVDDTYANFGGSGANVYSDHGKAGRDGGNVRHGRSDGGSSASADKTDVKVDQSKGNESEDSDDDDKRCPICLEDFDDTKQPKDLSKCKHKFCKECLDQAMKHKPVCPVCGVVYGAMKGNQPPGQMNVSESRYSSLPGYEGHGTITINYSFGGGTQGSNHPEPGNRYTGTSRTAYLPNNAEGQKVLRLLKQAFDAKLTFTIGTSVTSGARNTVTWNDIHHKTNTYGGAQSFGYPDPTYLSRVTEELAAKGIK